MKVILLPNSEEVGYEDELEAIKADVIIYDYHTEPYEGHGNMLIFKNGLWFHQNLGHCSCFGPLDDVQQSLKIPLTTNISNIRGAITQGLYEELASLIDIAIQESAYLNDQTVPNKYQVTVTRSYIDKVDVWAPTEEAAKTIAEHQIRLLAEKEDERLSTEIAKTNSDFIFKYDITSPAASGHYIKTIQV
jgi:hypothetical protein